MTQKAFQKTIIDYYQKNKRTFPWRKTRDPYAILVSEIMLQQTQTDRVVPKYENWLKHFPTFEKLAASSLQEVLKNWKGLGYNSRALRLKQAAQVVVEKYNGKLPKDYEKILDLPGIGPYTAGAVMAFAFNLPFPIIETNIRTVYIHFFFKNIPRPTATPFKGRSTRTPNGISKDPSLRRVPVGREMLVHDKEVLELVEKTLPRNSEINQKINVRDWYYALMDYGVMLKKTIGNLNVKSKHYTKQSSFKGSNRELRAKLLHFITEKPSSVSIITKNTLFENNKKENIIKNLDALEKEGFIQKRNQVYSIYESNKPR